MDYDMRQSDGKQAASTGELKVKQKQQYTGLASRIKVWLFSLL